METRDMVAEIEIVGASVGVAEDYRPPAPGEGGRSSGRRAHRSTKSVAVHKIPFPARPYSGDYWSHDPLDHQMPLLSRPLV